MYKLLLLYSFPLCNFVRFFKFLPRQLETTLGFQKLMQIVPLNFNYFTQQIKMKELLVKNE